MKVQLIDLTTPQDIWDKFEADIRASQDVCGIDCETQDRNRHPGLTLFNNKKRHVFDHRRTVMTGFSLYPNSGDTAYYINLNHADTDNRLPQEVVEVILSWKPRGASWIAHKASFEIVMFKQCLGIELTDIICTLQLAVSHHGPDEYALENFYSQPLNGIRPIVGDIIDNFRNFDPVKDKRELNANQQFVLGQFIGKTTDAGHSYNGFVKNIAWGYSLKQLARTLLGVTMTTYDEVLASAGASDMGDLTGPQVCNYGADDAYWAVMLFHKLVSTIDPSALVTFLEHENPMVHVFAETWLNGLRVNLAEVFARRDTERENYAVVLRELKGKIRELLPFPAEPNKNLMEWQTKWYEPHWRSKRDQIIAWANSPDSNDNFEQCFQVSNPIGNAWSEEDGVKPPRGGKLNLTHYYTMRVLLHDLLNHKLVRIGGDITTDKDARARMAQTFKDAGAEGKLEVLRLIDHMSGIEQTMKLYLTPYTLLMDPETECLYSVLSSMLASRRMGTRFPNPMALAKRGESTYVRGFFKGDRDDHLVVSADWSSVELVEIGEFSGDPEFAKVFGQTPYSDLHSGATVDCLKVDPRYLWLSEDEFISEFKCGRNPLNRDLFDFAGRPMLPDKWVKLMRTEIGKAANFNYWYSGALSTVGEKLGWSSDTMWQAVDRYRDRFSVAEAWRVSTIEQGCRDGFVTLPDGHRRVRFEATENWFLAMRRKFADVCADPAVMRFCDLALPRIQTRAKNQFINSIIQGMCARLAKDSILKIIATMDRNGARFMLPIHDELLFSVHRDYIPEFIPLMRQGMCHHPNYIKTLPLMANVAIGRTFKPFDRSNPGMTQIELDEASPITGIIPDEYDGQPLPPEMYPALVDWLMAA